MTDSERIQAAVRDAKEILANKDQYTGSLEDLTNLVTINTCILAAQSATEEQALDIFWLLVLILVFYANCEMSLRRYNKTQRKTK